MHRKVLLITAIPVLFTVLLFARSERGDEPDRIASPDREEIPAETENEQEEHHAVSLPALMEKDFDGRRFEIGAELARTDAYTRYAVSYLSGDLRISGIMNLPHGDGPFPVLVLNHGYIDTDIYTIGRGLKREQDYLARRGYAVVHPDYRNHAGSDDDPDNRMTLRLGYTEDVINAVLALRSADLPGVDADRTGMMGHSMGGGISQNIAVVRPDLVDAFVLYAPVSGDYRENFDEYTRRDDDDDDEPHAILEAYGDFEESPVFWDEVSPMSYYDRVAAPVMIHIGTADESTPPQWSYDIRDRLETANKDVALHVYSGAPHELIDQWPLMMSRTADFFDRHLRGTSEDE